MCLRIHDWMESQHLYGKEAHKGLIQDLERLGYKYVSGCSLDAYDGCVCMKKPPHSGGRCDWPKTKEKFVG